MRGLVVIVVIALARVASAQPQPQPQPQQAPPDDVVHRADEAMHRGLEAQAAGDHPTALAAFREAAALVPDANVPHKLAGEELETLGRIEEALVEYKRYVEISPTAKGADEIRGRIARLEAAMPGQLAIKCGILDATVTIDGKPIGVPPIAMKHPAGTVQIEITAPGYLPQRVRAELAPGKLVTVECELAHDVKLPPPVPKPPSDTPWYRRWSIIGPAIGVAALAAGFGIYAAVGNGVPDSDGGAHKFP